MEITHNHNAKSQLAKLLATENITVQHSPTVKTAWFDLKNRVLMLPLWRAMSEDLYDMLVVHEVGHALDTPAENFLEKITEIARRAAGSVSQRAIACVKDFLNVIEDARIDKRQKRRFPGARRNYIKGYKELIDNDFFGTATRDVNTMDFIDRLNIYTKGGAMLGIKFDKEEKAWLRKVEDAETFEEVLTLTEEIFKWAKDKMAERPEQEKDPMGRFRMPSGFSDDDQDEDENDYEDGFGDGEDGEDDYDSDSYGYGDGDDENEDEDGESSDNGDVDSDEKEESDKESRKSAGGENEATDSSERGEGDIAGGSGGGGEHVPGTAENLPESKTEKAWQEKSESLVLNSDVEYCYVRVPRMANYDKIVVDYKIVLAEQRIHANQYRSAEWMNSVRTTLAKWKSSEAAAVSFMVKEFEMRKSADEYSRTSISKTGMIDTNKLHSYKYNDDLFRRITTVATGKNHGFVMFVDWSSSMDYNLKKTLQQLFSLVMFCKRVQIPFEVYSFRSLNGTDHRAGQDGRYFTENRNELQLSPFKARNVLSSRMNIAELNEAMVYLWSMACGNSVDCDHMGSTPLNPCIAVAHEIVNRFRAKSKVQVVNVAFLTDGDSDSMSGYVHGLPATWKPRKYIIEDEITKKNYEIGGSSRYDSWENAKITPIFLKMLKERTGCNLMGFFLCSSSFDRMFYRYNDSSEDKVHKEAKESWRNNNFFTTTNAGYDEYYIINADKFHIASNNLKIDGTMSKKKMASEFIKFAEKKAISRVLLTNIVKRVTA